MSCHYYAKTFLVELWTAFDKFVFAFGAKIHIVKIKLTRSDLNQKKFELFESQAYNKKMVLF